MRTRAAPIGFFRARARGPARMQTGLGVARRKGGLAAPRRGLIRGGVSPLRAKGGDDKLCQLSACKASVNSAHQTQSQGEIEENRLRRYPGKPFLSKREIWSTSILLRDATLLSSCPIRCHGSQMKNSRESYLSRGRSFGTCIIYTIQPRVPRLSNF